MSSDATNEVHTGPRKMSAIEYFRTLPRKTRREIEREVKRQQKHGEQAHLAKAMLALGLINSYSDN